MSFFSRESLANFWDRAKLGSENFKRIYVIRDFGNWFQSTALGKRGVSSKSYDFKFRFGRSKKRYW